MEQISILGCGWLGSSLGEDLVSRGYKVAGSTTTEARLLEISKKSVDPFLIQLMPQLVGENIEAFFEADILVVAIPPKRKTGQTDLYLQQLREVVKVIQNRSMKVVFISSTSVYPDLNREVREEDADKSSATWEAEEIIRGGNPSNVTVIRFAGLVGDNRHPGRFFTGKKGLSGATNPVNLIHKKDCIEIIRKIIEKKIWGRTFNACSDIHPGKKAFYTKASSSIDLEPPEFSDETQGFKIINSDSLKSTLNYSFIYPNPLEMPEVNQKASI